MAHFVVPKIVAAISQFSVVQAQQVLLPEISKEMRVVSGRLESSLNGSGHIRFSSVNKDSWFIHFPFRTLPYGLPNEYKRRLSTGDEE